MSLVSLSPSVSAADFTITSTSDFDAGTKTDTATETELDNIDADELRINVSATPWERWTNTASGSITALTGDDAGTEYRRAFKLNFTGEFILYGVMPYIHGIVGSPQDIYVALLEPDGTDCIPNGLSGVIVETDKKTSAEITATAYNYFNFTKPVLINATSCVWVAFLTDGNNPAGAYYSTHNSGAPSGSYSENLQSKHTVSTDSGSTWGTPTAGVSIRSKVLTVNYTTSATWESNTISIPSGKRLDSIDITFDSRFAQHEYRAPNNATHYTNDTLPTSGFAFGAGQIVHPDIVDMGSVWNNHRYWMCHTPYPNGNDDDEFPQMVASNNTTTFVIPTGLTNPIWTIDPDAIAAGENAGDCDLAYDGTYLRAYWVYKNLTYDRWYVLSKRTTDGINWVPTGNDLENAIEILNVTVFPAATSPEVLYEDGTFHLWYIGTDSAGANANDSYVYYRSSTDGENFTAELNITSGFPVMTDTEFNVWHLDIDKVGSEYWGLFPMVHNRTAFNGGTKSGLAGLYWAWSSDRENWTFQDWYPIIHQGEDGDWDEREIYRSTFLMDGDTMRIWYSAANDPGAWFVSYTEATIQTRTITQVDFKVSGDTKASYTTDIRIGSTVTISTPDTGNFDSLSNADMTILLTFSSGGNATPIIQSLSGGYASVETSSATLIGIGATFDYIVISDIMGEDTVEFRPEPIGRFNNSTITYYWQFSDGQTSNEMNPTKTFEYGGITGDFTASLTICNERYCSHPVERDIHLIRWWLIILILAAIITPIILGMRYVDKKHR